MLYEKNFQFQEFSLLVFETEKAEETMKLCKPGT